MRIKLKLVGLLKRRQSAMWDSGSGTGVLETREAISVDQALDTLGIPYGGDDIVIIINDDVVPPSERHQAMLNDGDRLTLMPSMQGG